MQNSVIIGSTAIKSYFPDFKREPKDLDVAVRSEDLIKELAPFYVNEGEARVEFLVNPVIVNYARSVILEPDLLLTLKMSHIFWDIAWEKHMFDIQFLLSKGAKCDSEIFEELYEYWNGYHGQNKRSDLTMNAADFFDNALKEYDHDYLHTLLNPEPTYIGMLKDGAEVEIDEAKFQKASYEDKKNLIFEETEIMAFERFGSLHHRVAYGRMLKKYIIGHAPLYVARFLLENYKELYRPRHDFISLIRNKLDNKVS